MLPAEFVRFFTTDKMLLHGLLWKPDSPCSRVVIYVPGMGGGFACPSDLNPVARILIENGWAFMPVNLRSANPFGLLFEIFEDCVTDIAAAVAFVQSLGFTNIILAGDSLGSCRVTYYMVEKPDALVKGIIFLGAIKSPYLEACLRWSDPERVRYDAFIKGALKLVEAGKGREVLVYPGWFKSMPPLVLSAQTFVNLMGPPETSHASIIDNASGITVPILLIHGKKDSRSLPQNSKDIYAALPHTPDKKLVFVDSDHFFVTETQSAEVGQAMINWLTNRFAY